MMPAVLQPEQDPFQQQQQQQPVSSSSSFFASAPAGPAEVRPPSDYPYGGDVGLFPSGGGAAAEAMASPGALASSRLEAEAEVAHHWFYRLPGKEGASSDGREQWKPFSMIDSVAIEDVFLMDPQGIAVLTELTRRDL